MSKFNLFEYDDAVFPVLFQGKQGQVMESAGKDKGVVMEAADSGVASMAMSAVLSWAEEGDFSFQAFTEFAAGIADLDANEELGDEELELYNDILAASADAFLSLGADADNVDEFLNGEDDAAGEKLGTFITGALDDEGASDEELIAGFAGGEAVMESGILEASFKKMKVIRGGKVKIVKKRLGKVVLSAAQKAALKKARRKAFTGAAKLARKKSMRIREKRGM
jgi:hypothetical protein